MRWEREQEGREGREKVGEACRDPGRRLGEGDRAHSALSLAQSDTIPNSQQPGQARHRLRRLALPLDSPTGAAMSQHGAC